MKKENDNYIQVSVRIYQDESPDLHDLLSQMKRSKSTFLRRLCDIAITRENLQHVDPVDILNGTYFFKKHHEKYDIFTPLIENSPSKEIKDKDKDIDLDNLANAIQLDFQD